MPQNTVDIVKVEASTEINHGVKRPADVSSPLDLSSSVSSKRMKVSDATSNSPQNLPDYKPVSSPSPVRSVETLLSWSVEDVCAFINTIDLCSEYTDVSSFY